MLTMYPAVFVKEDNGYSAIFPDLNFLSTCGETLSETIEVAVDCLAGYIYTTRKMKDEDIPAPSDMEDINPAAVAREIEVNPDDSFVNMITVDVEEYAKTHFEKPVKKTLSIPAWLNDTAQNRGINFSAVLQEALKERIGITD